MPLCRIGHINMIGMGSGRSSFFFKTEIPTHAAVKYLKQIRCKTFQCISCQFMTFINSRFTRAAFITKWPFEAGAGASGAATSDGADLVAAAVVDVVLGVVGGESGAGAFVDKFQ